MSYENKIRCHAAIYTNRQPGDFRSLNMRITQTDVSILLYGVINIWLRTFRTIRKQL